MDGAQREHERRHHGRRLARLNTVLARRPQILILALGANDGLRGVPVERIHAQLAAIIERSQAASAQVLLAGMETPPLRGFDYSLAFRGIYPELARRFDVPLVPFLLAGVVANPDLNQPDLVHPNRDGARRIAENVWPYLVPLLSQATSTAEEKSRQSRVRLTGKPSSTCGTRDASPGSRRRPAARDCLRGCGGTPGGQGVVFHEDDTDGHRGIWVWPRRLPAGITLGSNQEGL